MSALPRDLMKKGSSEILCDMVHGCFRSPFWKANSPELVRRFTLVCESRWGRMAPWVLDKRFDIQKPVDLVPYLRCGGISVTGEDEKQYPQEFNWSWVKSHKETPEQRWVRMRNWVDDHIIKD